MIPYHHHLSTLVDLIILLLFILFFIFLLFFIPLLIISNSPQDPFIATIQNLFPYLLIMLLHEKVYYIHLLVYF